MFQVSTHALPKKWRHAAAIAAIASLTAACGGSGGSAPSAAIGPGTGGSSGSTACDPANSATAAECGTLLVGLTDAEGDIISYSVDVVSMSLQRANGATVEILPDTTRLDFSQLTDLSELVSAVLLPPGIYVGGSIQLDYSAAEVFVEAGGEVVSASVVDANAMPLGITDLRIDFADTGRLTVTRGQVAFMEMDFDLAASHTIDTSVTPPLVTAEPFISAEITPVDEKELRVRGALVSVDVANQSYELRLMPWHKRVGDHGPVTVNTTDTTVFEFGDVSLTGDQGLVELESLGAGTLTAAFGTLNLNDREFTAEIVLARDAIEGDRLDALRGNIVSRSGNLLTVKAGFAINRGDRPRFHRIIQVEVGPDTRVVKVTATDESLDENDLSVGQRIVAFGQFNPNPTNIDPANAIPLLDATQGGVRMHPTHVFGRVTEIMTGQITMDLRAIDRLGIDHFDFTGTGMAPSLDADPNAYEVATDVLPLTAISVDRSARVAGYVTAFGMAPPDFTGRTILGHDQLRSALGIGWIAPGTTAPFSSMGIDGLVPDLSNPAIGSRHHMLIGRELIDLFDLPMAPTITPGQARTLFSLHEPGHIELFTDFADFVDELTLRLNNSDTVRSMAAYGGYDELLNQVAAKKVIVFTNPGTTQ